MCGPETQIAAGVVHYLASQAWTSRPNKRARVFSIQSAVNASMVESSDYELEGLEQSSVGGSWWISLQIGGSSSPACGRGPIAGIDD